MNRWLIMFCCWLALGRASAQLAMDTAPARGVSGQFVAVTMGTSGLPSPPPTAQRYPGGFLLNSSLKEPSDSAVPLEPAVLVISCERVKESLLRTLGRRDQWRGRINLVINPSLPAEQGTILTGLHGRGGWSYQLALPSPIKPRLLLRAIVQAILMEIANRNAGDQSAEVPFWLIAGMSAHLEADNLSTLILQPQVLTVGKNVRLEGLAPVRELLRQHPPLTFQELSLPEPETLAGANCDLYLGCARLFFEELLRLKDGNRCLCNMIVQLPRHWNWQTAFLEAFSPHFAQLLDVEKWWGLACVNFTGVDFDARFSPRESSRKLQESLDVPVEVRLSRDELPAPAEITLQEVITDWDPSRAAPVLERAMESLELLRRKAAPEFIPLLDRYLGTLQSFLNDTRPGRPAWLERNHQVQLAGLRHTTRKELDTLDAQRAALRSRYVSPAARSQAQDPGHPPGPPADSANPISAAALSKTYPTKASQR